MLLYVAFQARTEPQYSLFVNLQNVAILIATISKLGIDTLVIADAEKKFRLGKVGSSIMLVALFVCTASVAGISNKMTFLAAFALSALSIQNAIKASLAIQDTRYLRAAVESSWVLPVLLGYCLLRRGQAEAWEISGVCGVLFIIRLDRSFLMFTLGETRGGFEWRRVVSVWVFQVLNIGLFRLDQTVVATIWTRGGGTSSTSDILFWAKANDLANAAATALGGVLNREEREGRALQTTRLVRSLFPVLCAAIYFGAWAVLSRQWYDSFVALGLLSLGSACLSFEVNRGSFLLLWRKDNALLIRIWTAALTVGLVIATIGMLKGATWLLPLAVTVQLVVAIAALCVISKRAS